MAYLAAAVIVVGIIGLLNLVLALGVIRRLREHTVRLTALEAGHGHGHSDGIMLGAGSAVQPFQAVTEDGVTVTRDGLAGPTLVAFFSPDCTPCRERMPQFIRYAAEHPGGRDRVVGVVVSDRAAAGEYVAALSPVARVVVESDGGPLCTAFGVQGFPAISLIDESGVVVASGSLIEDLSAPVAG
ncbi:TlpA disulfide reductase family protein [Micromonospora sp. C28ISP2-4]|uniref:TlpA disulfide reductase family protein n=1 Tax=Micromonospora sp. C28ISP2-4 TaxID=3059523 RepID=UPI0026776191|nr:TlpA disulfide reductase family protein [Micromonospora sp. C28ISP2-4]MDO3687525.1 TlpA disulfide reductase family protein [Micromonospora sp. C28ISP2-4]